MIETVQIFGASGRVGTAMSARLRERGVALREDGAELVLLCVPDAAIAEVAQGIEPGPWIAHTSGATSLSALDPHVRRFGLHPLQTFTHQRGPEQLDDSHAAVVSETPEARHVGWWLAQLLGLEPFDLADEARPLYHAGAAIASNYLVTLHRVAVRALRGRRCAGSGARAVDAPDDRQRLRADRPDLARRLGDRGAPPRSDPHLATRARGAVRRPRRGNDTVKLVRTIAELRDALEPNRNETIALVPTMGAFHEGHLSLLRAARAEADVVVASLFVNPAQFGEGSDLNGYPRDEAHDVSLAEAAGVDILFAPDVEEMYPPGFQTWVDVDELGARLEGVYRPGHFRGVTTICLKLFNIVRPRRAYFGQKDAQQVAVLRRMILDLNLELELRVLPTVRDADGVALSSRNARLSPEERERARALHRALATKDAERARELLSDLDVDYVEVADFEPRVLAAAVRVGTTRLIDNVILEGDTE